ncbi:hypothetical protein C8A03DRAFT_13842 [Achaetomium macrosporum]|uniref:BTB domain-containing protein n=1 Tax=Achaetomium macrosporum TaxID=79813 RepID=A0AAN7CD02_9PEZI|nr:hypothetical protein C8A03DRAFT_13842 [Achaetomium macrosporum]
MDTDGDLILRVGSDGTAEMTDFKVCSATLRRVSPVFKAMLFGTWIESKPPRHSGRQWMVSLPEDDPSAMRVILHIVHGHFDKVPASSTSYALSDLVVTADKYDMLRCLRPWAAKWWKEATHEFYRRPINPLLVHVAREFGDESSYASGLKDLILRSCLTVKRSESAIPEEVTEGTIFFRANREPLEICAPLSPPWRCGLSDVGGW